VEELELCSNSMKLSGEQNHFELGVEFEDFA